MEHHNKQVEGTERLIRFLAAHHRLPESYDAFIYRCQLVQGEALKCAVEHWRRRKFKTAGSLFWQLNDCWPVSSWSVIDSALRPKAAYYFVKRFYAPLLVTIQKEREGVRVWVTNDLLERVSATLAVSLRSFDGRRTRLVRKRIIVPANASVSLSRIDLPGSLDRSTQYVHARLTAGGSVVSENRFFFEEPKHLLLPPTRVVVTIFHDTDGTPVARLKAWGFAKGVHLEIDGKDSVFEDNYFDIDAGASKEVRLGRGISLSKAQRSLRVRWLQ